MTAIILRDDFFFATVRKLVSRTNFKYHKDLGDRIILADTKKELEQGLLKALKDEKGQGVA